MILVERRRAAKKFLEMVGRATEDEPSVVEGKPFATEMGKNVIAV
jgi:hypothetical protein